MKSFLQSDQQKKGIADVILDKQIKFVPDDFRQTINDSSKWGQLDYAQGNQMFKLFKSSKT